MRLDFLVHRAVDTQPPHDGMFPVAEFLCLYKKTRARERAHVSLFDQLRAIMRM